MNKRNWKYVLAIWNAGGRWPRTLSSSRSRDSAEDAPAPPAPRPEDLIDTDHATN
jgi:hypothetical protein